jgi:hypothetical protein
MALVPILRYCHVKRMIEWFGTALIGWEAADIVDLLACVWGIGFTFSGQTC